MTKSMLWHCKAVLELKKRWPEVAQLQDNSHRKMIELTQLFNKKPSNKNFEAWFDVWIKHSALLNASLEFSLNCENKKYKIQVRKTLQKSAPK